MLAPERDQTPTREAIKEFDTLLERYPNSKYLPEVQKAARDAKDRLSEASYKVGVYYYRVKWWPGAVDRFREVLKNDPADANGLLAMGLLREAQGNAADARSWYEKAAAADPTWTRPLMKLAELARAAGDRATASRHLTRVIEMDAGSTDGQQAETLLQNP